MDKEVALRIDHVVRLGLCTGCGTCVSLCPAKAVSISVDKKLGIYLPKIDLAKCSCCSTCYRVCPGVSVDFETLNKEFCSDEGNQLNRVLLGSYISCYAGYSTDSLIRFDSSSGGIVTQLLVFALEEGLIDGALVTRMNKDNPLEPEPFIARTRKEITEASKSKYCPVPANIALKEMLKSHGRYAFVGLPCHIHGLRKAQLVNQRLRERVVLAIGLFCSHNDSFFSTAYMLRRLQVNPYNVTSICYRGKGWPGKFIVEKKSGETAECTFHDWIRLHEYCFFTPDRCLVCCDHAAELADISTGDAWLPEYSTDKCGTSILISRNDKSEELLGLANAKKAIILTEVQPSRTSKSQGNVRFKKNGFRVRCTISRLQGKTLPKYDIVLPKSGIVEIPRSLIIFANRRIASLNCFENNLKVLESLQASLKKIYTKSTSSEH